ncbi:hypothetical protein [Rhodococcus sp. WY5]|nr:hypothetical protein [Rhodococcus sp. WY5]
MSSSYYPEYLIIQDTPTGAAPTANPLAATDEPVAVSVVDRS